MNRAAHMPAAIVFAGSGAIAPSVRARLPEDADVVAADSGLGVATALGIPVDLLVGDLDSADPATVAAAEAAGISLGGPPPPHDGARPPLPTDATIAPRGRR